MQVLISNEKGGGREYSTALKEKTHQVANKCYNGNIYQATKFRINFVKILKK